MNTAFYKRSAIARLKNAPVIFRLLPQMAKKSPYGEGSRHNMTFRLPSIDEIFDSEARKNRKIRYVLGEESIFATEQTSETPVLADIIFVNGVLTVQQNQINLLKYLELSNYNNTNPNKMPGKISMFYRVDVEADSKDTVETMEIEADALYTARNMEPQKLVGYARVLGINTDRSMYEIKHDVMTFAKDNPALFLESIDNPRTERKQVILDAVDYGIIDLNHHANEVNWVMGTKRPKIIHTPVGVDKLDFFTEYTFDSEGEEVYAEILRKINKSENIGNTKEVEEVIKPKDEEVLVKKKESKTKD